MQKTINFKKNEFDAIGQLPSQEEIRYHGQEEICYHHLIFQQGNWRQHLAKMAIQDTKSVTQEVWCKLSFETINKPIDSFE